jgi:surfactin synthase thioesterase subunit
VPLAALLPEAIQLRAVLLPGREARFREPAHARMTSLVGALADALAPDPAERYALFGHSMGALVAFDVARRFEAAGNPIAALFVSASAAPGHAGYEYIPDSDRGLLDAVTEMTGVNPEFLESEEFAAKILPTLRGYKAIVNYECPPDATVSCPIFAFYGDDDEVATHQKVAPWSERTTSEFTSREFPGHHFYLNDVLSDLVEDIQGRILRCCVVD